MGDSTDDSTTSTQLRWWLTNDVLAGVLVVGFLGTIWLHALGWLDVSTLPGNWMTMFSLYVALAVTWAFGTDVLEAWRNGRGGRE